MINNEFLLQALGAGQPMSVPAMGSPLMQVLGGGQRPQMPQMAMNNPNMISQTPGLADALKAYNAAGQLVSPTAQDTQLRGSIFEPNHMLPGPTTTPQNNKDDPVRDFGPRLR